MHISVVDWYYPPQSNPLWSVHTGSTASTTSEASLELCSVMLSSTTHLNCKWHKSAMFCYSHTYHTNLQSINSAVLSDAQLHYIHLALCVGSQKYVTCILYIHLWLPVRLLYHQCMYYRHVTSLLSIPKITSLQTQSCQGYYRTARWLCRRWGADRSVEHNNNIHHYTLGNYIKAFIPCLQNYFFICLSLCFPIITKFSCIQCGNYCWLYFCIIHTLRV